MVSRTGFTGDLGYELWVRPSLALTLWDALYAAGRTTVFTPTAKPPPIWPDWKRALLCPIWNLIEALKTIHFEHDHTPFELSLGWLVDFKKPHFQWPQGLD